MHFNYKLIRKVISISINFQAFQRRSKHSKVVLDYFQCPKAKILKRCVKERKTNLHLGLREGHVKIRACSQDCEI